MFLIIVMDSIAFDGLKIFHKKFGVNMQWLFIEYDILIYGVGEAHISKFVIKIEKHSSSMRKSKVTKNL